MGGGQQYLDLLWRWYEKTGNYGKAANLLSRLADTAKYVFPQFYLVYFFSEDIALSQRYIYLSHAIICAESSSDVNIRAGLEELKDKVEVTRIQLSIKSV